MDQEEAAHVLPPWIRQWCGEITLNKPNLKLFRFIHTEQNLSLMLVIFNVFAFTRYEWICANHITCIGGQFTSCDYGFVVLPGTCWSMEPLVIYSGTRNTLQKNITRVSFERVPWEAAYCSQQMRKSIVRSLCIWDMLPNHSGPSKLRCHGNYEQYLWKGKKILKKLHWWSKLGGLLQDQ